MSDATNKMPSLDEQIAEFKSFVTLDGEVRAEPKSGAVAAGEGGEDDEPKAQTAAEKLAALDGKKAAKAAKEEPAGEGEGDDGEGDVDDDPKPEPKPAGKQSAADKRIAQAVGRQRAAERELASTRARMDALEARLNAGLTAPPQNANNQPVADKNAPPDPEDFQYGELDSKYIAAVARYETKQALMEEGHRQEQSRRSQSEQTTAAQAKAMFDNFETSGLAKYDDFDVVVTETAKRGEWALSPILAALMVDSDHGTDIAYHLASNKAEAKKVFEMTPAKQAAWFGRREAVLSSEEPGAGGSAARMVSRAPAATPHVARGSGSRPPPSADTSDFAAFERMASQK